MITYKMTDGKGNTVEVPAYQVGQMQQQGYSVAGKSATPSNPQPSTQPSTQPTTDSNSSDAAYAAYLKALSEQQAQGAQMQQMIEQQAAAQAAKINAARASAVAGYNSQISNAPQQYDPLRNQASFQGAKTAQAVKEAMAAGGLANSGDNMSAQIQIGTGTQNSINDLNMQEQNLVNSLKKAIADTNNQADADLISSTAQSNAQKVQAAMEQANQTANSTYSVWKDKVAQDDKNLQQQIDTIGQYYNNFAAEIEKRQAANPNDPLIPYLRQAAQEKLMSQQAEKQAQANAQAAANKEAYNRAMEIWKAQGIASPEVAKVLGIPVGSKTESYIKTQYETNKPYYAPSTPKASTPAVSSNQYQSYIEKTFFTRPVVGKDTTGNPVYGPNEVLTEEGRYNLAQYLKALAESGVDKDIVDALAGKYGITVDDLYKEVPGRMTGMQK